jgi:integrase
MARDRTGSFSYRPDGLYARVTYVDEWGKRHQKKRKAISGTVREANRLIRELLAEIEEQDEKTVEGAKLTFRQLAEYNQKHYAQPAEYDAAGIKKAGLRAYKDTQNKLAVLTEYFGTRKIRSITYGDLDLFKAERLRTPTMRKTRVRSIASVHRELELLRRVLTIAVQQKWLLRNPFRDGEALIKKAEETLRERIATREEEERLLAACDDDHRREHLRPFLICAFDTGFRASEMYNLKVSDVDFEDNCITAVSYKGKRRRQRQFDMTKRLAAEMQKLVLGKQLEECVFDFNSVKRSFNSAKRLAGLPDFRLHDTRHTATTRLISRGLSLSEAGKLMGHTQPSTTWRYMHADKSTRKRAAELLEEDEG